MPPEKLYLIEESASASRKGHLQEVLSVVSHSHTTQGDQVIGLISPTPVGLNLGNRERSSMGRAPVSPPVRGK